MYSVVMPARPREPYLLDALRSIERQTIPPARIVVVINGSGAQSSSLIPDIRDAFPTVDVLTLGVAGMALAVNHGLRTVTTPFVGILDSDDLWCEEKQERQLRAFAADPSLDAVSCEAINFQSDPDGAIVEGKAVVSRMFSAVTFRTDAFDRFGYLDDSISHFAWLVRWWSAAQDKGIRTVGLEYRGLWRRVHDSNGWITDGVAGRSHLLSELRRISAARTGGVAASRRVAP